VLKTSTLASPVDFLLSCPEAYLEGPPLVLFCRPMLLLLPMDSAAECCASAPRSAEVLGTDAEACSPAGSIRLHEIKHKYEPIPPLPGAPRLSHNVSRQHDPARQHNLVRCLYF